MYKFKLFIGDWNNNGHGHCDTLIIRSNKAVEEVRKAYFKAVENTNINLANYLCAEYEDCYICKDQVEELTNCGINLKLNSAQLDRLEKDLLAYVDYEQFVDIVLQFIGLGDWGLELEITQDDIPALQFCGVDDAQNHIGNFGYGLF